MEAIRNEVIERANKKLTEYVTDYLKKFEKLESGTNGQLIGWCGGDAYFIHINMGISAHADKAIISEIA